jgi:peptidoglycan/LPS O-acetylase OafA/YrhL
MERTIPEQTTPHMQHQSPRLDSRVSNPQNLAPAPSILLDIVRFLAALTVAIGHVSQGYFTTGWPPILMSFAEGAVSVFFILSGFMIRYITTVKYGDLRRYTADRVARIYSVALPAIALTILFDLLSSHFNPAYYAANFGPAARATTHLSPIHALLSQTWVLGLIRIVISLAMLSQSWFHDSSPLSNSPFWSLSYECVYYALFGIALYLRGKKRIIACIVVFLLIGPTIFLMFPLWLLGCAAYDAYQDGALKRNSIAKLVGFSLLSIAGVHGSRALIDHFHLHWFYIGRLVPSMDIVAIVTAAILTPLCIATRNLQISEDHFAVWIIRKVAAATYPLYLIHFPLFVLLAAIVPYPHASLWAKLALLATALTLSLLLSGPCDSFKDYLRRKLLPSRNA